VRRRRAPSEIGRLVRPLGGVLDAAWHRLHWWIATIAVFYSLSGITIVRSDEVAMVLRWGRLLGETPALQVHGPGLLLALPRPIDEVLRVQTATVREQPVLTLASASMDDPDDVIPTPNTMNPVRDGYAVTGDHNIVQLVMVARYRVRDPVAWQFYGPETAAIMRAEVAAAMARSMGEMGVDRLLSDGRTELIATATRRVQQGLDAARAGVELTSLELTKLGPPEALAPAFASVQSAFIAAETSRRNAQAFAETAVPQATAQVDQALQAARAQAATGLAVARGEAQAFRMLAGQHRSDPAVVRVRLYREGIERALADTRVRWIPPPGADGYNGMRITIGSPGGGGVAGGALPTVGVPGGAGL
jgi:membrane protease subunit HflK